MNKNVFLYIFLATAFFVANPIFSADKVESQAMADLDSNQAIVQMNACQKIGDDKDKNAIGKLIGLLEKSSDKRVLSSAAAALGAIGEKGESSVALHKMAQNSKLSTVQYTSILALANINDPEFKEKTIELLTNIESQTSDDLLKDLAVNLKVRLEK